MSAPTTSRHKPKYDLTGLAFGRLTVLAHVEGLRCICRCSCGAEVSVPSRGLREGRTRSCGCLQRDNARERATRHGGSSDPLYKVLASLLQRCNNPSCYDYQWYGAKGVKVAPEWSLQNYPAFKAWALASGYKPGLTIDREDPFGDYTPENCRWITIQEQQRNRRGSRARHATNEKEK